MIYENFMESFFLPVDQGQLSATALFSVYLTTLIDNYRIVTTIMKFLVTRETKSSQEAYFLMLKLFV